MREGGEKERGVQFAKQTRLTFAKKTVTLVDFVRVLPMGRTAVAVGASKQSKNLPYFT